MAKMYVAWNITNDEVANTRVTCLPDWAATFSSSDPEPQAGSYAVVPVLVFWGVMPIT